MMKRLDFLVIGLVALLSLLPLPVLAAQRAAGVATVTVTQRGETLYTGPLAEDAVVVTPDGGNTVEIRGGQAYMHFADCPDGLCVAAGSADAAHPVVCLPNGVVVAVTGGETEGAYDAVSE